MGIDAKDDVVQHNEVIHDHDLISEKPASDQHVAALNSLSADERVIERQLRRKIDFLIMPLVVLVYLLNYIDRNSYAAAKLQGLTQSLHLNDSQYQTGLSILFVGYVLMQVPSNALLNFSGRPSWYIGCFTILWGLVATLTSQAKNYTDIVVCRFFLGAVEAPFFAGVLFYLSCWYTREELNLRMSIFYAGALLSGAFGSLIAAGILNGLNGASGLRAWQWLYIIEGVITIFVGIIIVFVLPDFPSNWSLLTPEMKHVAVRRMAIDAADADIDEPGGMSQLRGIKQAFTDPKTYILALAYHGITGAAGIQNFFPTLTATLGYDHIISLLLVAPPYVFITIVSMIHSHAGDKSGSRFWFYIGPIPIYIAGALIFMFTDGFGVRYFSLFLLMSVFLMNGTTYAWIANSIPRPRAKRAAALAFINSFGNMASIWTPYMYTATSAPHYRLAMGVNIGLVAVAALGGLTLRLYLQRENRQLARWEDKDAVLTDRDLRRLQRTADAEGVSVAEARLAQKGFRYLL